MADKTFTAGTVIDSAWLNDVNRLTYDLPSTASGKGASLVGVQDAPDYFSGTNAEAIFGELATPYGKFQNELNVLRYIPPSEWPLIQAGTSTTDHASMIVAAFNALKGAAYGGTLFFPPGQYNVSTAAMQWNTGGSNVSVNIQGAGQKATVFKKFGTSTTPVLDLSVTALGNGTFTQLAGFSVVGINTCSGIRHTLFARYQMSAVAVSGSLIGIENIASLIASYYDCHLSGNVTGYKASKSGAVLPNLVSFYGGAAFQNSSWGVDLVDAEHALFYGFDIELNGTAGNTGTGGLVVRSTVGASSSNGHVGLFGSWVEANNGNGILCESNANLSLSLNDIKFVSNEAGNHLTTGAGRTLIIESCNANAATSVYTIGAFSSAIIRGGSIWTVANSAVNWIYEGVILGGAMVPYRVGGSTAAFGTYNQTQGKHNSGTGNVSVPTATATTLFTVSGSGPRLITVFACLGGAGANYTSTGRFAWDGSNLVRMGGENAANHTLTASGANVQSTQISGVTQTVFYVYDVIG